jgi:glutamyl-tRNA synthetase
MNAITPLHTRIAPSPSGDFHIGTARTAYFNWLAAKASGGTFTIRVDDTNKELSKVEHVSVIFETMRWLGLDHDRSFFQSKRFPLYEIKAQELVAAGKATVLDNGAVALTEIVMPDTWHDEIGGDIKVSDDDREKVRM